LFLISFLFEQSLDDRQTVTHLFCSSKNDKFFIVNQSRNLCCTPPFSSPPTGAFLPMPLSPLFFSFGYHQNATGLFVVRRKRREKTIESDCPILTSCGPDIERPETRALPTAIAFSNALDQSPSSTSPFFCPPFFCHSHFAPFRFFRLSPKHNRSFCGWQKTTRKDDEI